MRKKPRQGRMSLAAALLFIVIFALSQCSFRTNEIANVTL